MEHLHFMPHSVCFLYRPDLIWLHVISDIGIALAYLAIPLLIWLSLNRFGKVMMRELRTVGWWFAAFIVLCALTHVLSVFTMWTGGLYYYEGAVKAITALVSAGAAWHLASTGARVASAMDAVMDVQEKERLRAAIRRVLSGRTT